MNPDHFSELILTYRYWILIPLSFIEGPVVSFLAGALVPLGYFRISFLFAIFFARDLVFDSLYYMLGHYGNKTRFVKHILRKIGVTEDHLHGVRKLWNEHSFKTMFFGKLAYGIAVAFMIAAGIVHVPFRRFFKYSFAVAVIQYVTFITLGYFLGTAFSNIIQVIIQDFAIVLFVGAILGIGYYVLSARIRKVILRAEHEAEEESSQEKKL